MKHSGIRFGIMEAVVAAALVFAAGMALAADCGRVTIGEMDWNSARVIANVEKFILEVGYGCEVEILQTTTVPCLTSMVEKGEPDVASEFWVNSVKENFEKGVAEGRIVAAGDVLSDSVEGWYLPAYFVEAHPDVRTVAQVMANAQLFQDPEDPAKGRFYNCPSGWACKIINTNLFRAYGMGKHFNNFDPGSAEGLSASLAKAYERQEPWIGYYWEPSAILGKYPMVMVDMAAFDAKGHECNARKDCDAPYAGRYPPTRVLSATTKAFADNHPEVFAFIRNVSIPNAVMNAVLAWGEDLQAEGNEMAGYFMVKHEALWSSWLPADVAAKVKAALK